MSFCVLFLRKLYFIKKALKGFFLSFCCNVGEAYVFNYNAEQYIVQEKIA